MQKRAKTGVDFEKTLEKDGWVVRSTKPKIKWDVRGNDIFSKLININYDATLLKIDEYNSKLCKHDIYNSKLNEYREVKKYYIDQLNEWKLYSEPYFKIATKHQQSKIKVYTYNKFVKEFYNHNKSLGTFEWVVNKMIECCTGIDFIDGFIPKEKLEFRTVIVDGWRGYNRITIQVKLKDENGI